MSRRVLTAALLAALPAAACAREAPYEKPLTPVRVETVAAVPAGAALRYSAAMLPRERVDLAFKVPGYVAEIARVRDRGGLRAVHEGDRVRRGEVLARVRTDDYEVKVRQARSQLAEAEAAYAQAKDAFDRATTLFGQQSATKPDLEAARAAFDTVTAKRDGARALVAEAENALADTALRAPIDGLLIKRLVEVGSLVGPGTPGFVVADTSSIKVVFGAPDLVVRGLALHAPQAITTEAYPNERFEGRITGIAPAADPGSLVFDVEVTVPNGDGRLKAGMVASLELAHGAAAPQLAVPIAAVLRSPRQADGYAVYVVEERDGQARVRLRDVALGALVGNAVAVTSGLRAGDRVVVSGATIVSDGEQVQILR